ncbi:MAG: glycerophosphodiester phosphodiesterase family protein [Bacteroidota bacterium]
MLIPRTRKGVLPFLMVVLLWSCHAPTDSTTKTSSGAENDLTAQARFTTFAQWLSDPQPLVSAHRGGPYPGYPENAIETFQNIVDHTSTVIECDIAMTQDSVLVLMHDQTLDRTTTGAGKVSDWQYEELRALRLVDNEGDTTAFVIPTLKEALVWGKGKALFTLDVKRGVPWERVLAAVASHEAASYAAIITYRIEDAKQVYALNPGLLISVSAGDDGALEQILQSGIPSENLLGFVGTREPKAHHYQKLQELGIKTILGTLGNLDQSAAAKGDDRVYLKYLQNGANILATDRPLEVARVLQQP